MDAPRVLTIAGSDPSGGAGLQADLKTFHAFRCYGMAVVTALTAQNTLGVRGVQAPDPSFVEAQIEALVRDCPPSTTKTGMLFSADVIECVARWARRGDLGLLVVDPVMVATSGDRLLRGDAEQAMRDVLVPVAALVTPNLGEAGVLVGAPVHDVESAATAAGALVGRGAAAALVKGGHLEDDDRIVDVLVEGAREPVLLEHPRVAGGEFHGTGCTLSAAIAAGLAHGRGLTASVRDGVSFVHAGLRTAWRVGAGARPVNHLAAGVEATET